MATLALAGYGFGSSVVPMTSVTLSEVSPERSGMAASATNTSRELGSVFGVAVLGALVNAQLTGALTHRLKVFALDSNSHWSSRGSACWWQRRFRCARWDRESRGRRPSKTSRFSGLSGAAKKMVEDNVTGPTLVGRVRI